MLSQDLKRCHKAIKLLCRLSIPSRKVVQVCPGLKGFVEQDKISGALSNNVRKVETLVRVVIEAKLREESLCKGKSTKEHSIKSKMICITLKLIYML